MRRVNMIELEIDDDPRGWVCYRISVEDCILNGINGFRKL